MELYHKGSAGKYNCLRTVRSGMAVQCIYGKVRSNEDSHSCTLEGCARNLKEEAPIGTVAGAIRHNPKGCSRAVPRLDFFGGRKIRLGQSLAKV